jgi:hypothetical protein
MSTPLETLHAGVLRLCQADRARLLDRLIASLDADAAAEAAWDALAEQREGELGSGAIRPVPVEVAIARLDEIRGLVVKHDRKQPGFGATRT